MVTRVNHPPSHERPLGATVKPGSQAMQVKEPSVLVQTPVGHTPGVWHSSISKKKKKMMKTDKKKMKKRLVIGY